MSETSGLVSIEGLSRRDAIRRIALALTAAGTGSLDFASAQHVHKEAQGKRSASGDYQRQFLTEHEFNTVSRLAELIVPADKDTGSAVDAGAPEFIDLLCSQNERLGHIYTGGLGWLDARMRKRHGSTFVEATAQQQTDLLDLLAEAGQELAQSERRWDVRYGRFRDYGVKTRSDAGAGVRFFDWVRKMSVDAYYTSEIGIKDLGFKGNQALSEYTVPQEAIDYVMRRSPFA